MKLEVYNDIVNTIRDYRGLPKDCRDVLKQKYKDIPANTLYGILSLDIQHKMKINHNKLFGSNKNYYDIYMKAVRNGESVGILLRLAKDLSVPPALLAKNILEKHCEIHDHSVSRNEIGKLFRDTTLIQDKDLAYEVYLCVLYDNVYGPIADATGVSVGQEYELKLQNYLTEHNLAFRNEEYLRSRGYDKTPDFKLEVPIAVNGFIINWIESKARFGNLEIHHKYIKEQFLSYWNRFGPGLVIYWFGFIDILSESSEKRFIIMDHFPENITYMDPTCIEPTL
ncbi:CDAN1-interacting nuclease 1 [Megalopta genalis]|uniref:CDAN1-interacting nuclease 1 n=1 Tax=Megalopta genalis TaxID=115081 RepID=UPI0014436FE4|nr:protein C15orf41 homolog [Megalopta genalis]